jgi:hypothetical protein
VAINCEELLGLRFEQVRRQYGRYRPDRSQDERGPPKSGVLGQVQRKFGRKQRNFRKAKLLQSGEKRRTSVASVQKSPEEHDRGQKKSIIELFAFYLPFQPPNRKSVKSTNDS